MPQVQKMQKSRKQEMRLPFQASSTTFLTGNHYYNLLCILPDFYWAYTNIYSFIVCVEEDYKIDIVRQIPFFFFIKILYATLLIRTYRLTAFFTML